MFILLPLQNIMSIQSEMSASVLAGSHKASFYLDFMATAEVLERASANAQVHFIPLPV